VIVSSTQIDKINTTSPLVLQLLSTNGTLLNETILTICSGVFAGYITVPEIRYYYQVEGYDIIGYPFSKRKSLSINPVLKPIAPTIVPKIITCDCENGGTCIVQFNRNMVCRCLGGYSGQLCQKGLFLGIHLHTL